MPAPNQMGGDYTARFLADEDKQDPDMIKLVTCGKKRCKKQGKQNLMVVFCCVYFG